MVKQKSSIISFFVACMLFTMFLPGLIIAAKTKSPPVVAPAKNGGQKRSVQEIMRFPELFKQTGILKIEPSPPILSPASDEVIPFILGFSADGKEFVVNQTINDMDETDVIAYDVRRKTEKDVLVFNTRPGPDLSLVKRLCPERQIWNNGPYWPPPRTILGTWPFVDVSIAWNEGDLVAHRPTTLFLRHKKNGAQKKIPLSDEICGSDFIGAFISPDYRTIAAVFRECSEDNCSFNTVFFDVFPLMATLYFEAGTKFYSQGDYTSAFICFASSLALDSSSTNATSQAAKAAARSNNASMTERYLRYCRKKVEFKSFSALMNDTAIVKYNKEAWFSTFNKKE